MLTIEDHMRAWYELPVAVIDFETTGPDPKECAPVEVAVVRFEPAPDGKGNVVVGRWSTLVNPGVPIPEGAQAVHGISDADVADAPRAAELASVLEVQARELLLGAIPCGYNGHSFDRVVLHRTHITHDATVPATVRNFPWLDPLTVIRHIDRYVGGKGRHKLTTTCARHGIPMPTAHRATADAEATGLLLYSPPIRKVLADMTIGELLRRQLQRAAAQEADFQKWKAAHPLPDGEQG